ncbi:NAD(P)H-dependent oxidoreductase, partial [Pseudomonas viridiflava]|uniref:NAD(P)H-dependent oxidoreductase n=2 Tax=Bacteria TaxID=2 RepID=UPI00197E60D7
MTTTPISSVLIVHAHPEPASFSTAQAHGVRRALEAQGLHVDLLDLYAQAWQPVLDRHEFPAFDG